MAFWGMSKEGKKAKGNSREIDDWLLQRGKDAYGRGDTQYGKGDAVSDVLQDEYGKIALDPNAFGTPEDLTATGGQVMPWVDQMIKDRGSRTSEMLGDRGKLLDEQGRNIDTYGKQNENDIVEGGKRLSSRDQGYHEDILANQRDAYGGMRTNSNNSFGDQRTKNEGLFDKLNTDAGATFDKSIEMVRPGSEARASTAARSFAPQVSRVMQRLRAAGIDPRTPEGQSLLANVEGQRSRAMDDQLGDAITATSNLNLQKFDTQSGLQKEGAANERDLALKQLLNDQGIGMEELNAMTTEKLRSLAQQQGIDDEMVMRKLTNREDVHGQNQGLLDKRMTEAGIGYDAKNADDILANDLQLGRYHEGVDARGRNIGAQQTGREGLGGVMNTAYGQGNFQDQYGNQSFNQAKGGFDQTHQQEAANAGWGKKLVLGGISAGLNAVAPGSGQVFSTMAGGQNVQLPWGQQPKQQQFSATSPIPQAPNTSASSWATRPMRFN